MTTRREIIRQTVEDLVADFVDSDRKEDEDLPRGAIGDAVRAGEVSVEEIIAWFADGLRSEIVRGFGGP